MLCSNDYIKYHELTSQRTRGFIESTTSVFWLYSFWNEDGVKQLTYVVAFLLHSQLYNSWKLTLQLQVSYYTGLVVSECTTRWRL